MSVPASRKPQRAGNGDSAVKRGARQDRRAFWVRNACPGWNRKRRATIRASRAVSPAARLLIETGAVFDIGCDHLLVAESHSSGVGPQADVLILHGTDYNDGDVRAVVRAVQVRDLERLIEDGVIDIAFGPNARDYNRSRGWSRNGSPTLAALGIDPWR